MNSPVRKFRLFFFRIFLIKYVVGVSNKRRKLEARVQFHPVALMSSSQLKALLVTYNMPEEHAGHLLEAMADPSIGLTSIADVYAYKWGGLAAATDGLPDLIKTLAGEIKAKVLGKHPGSGALGSPAEENAFTRMIKNSLEVARDEERVINEQLRLTKPKEDVEGLAVVTADQVDVMRRSERDAAGGVALPFSLEPSPKMVTYYMRTHTAKVKSLREYPLSRACTAYMSRERMQKRERDREVGELDDEGIEGDTALASCYRILLDAAALGIATADVTSVGADAVSNDAGTIVSVKGARKRIGGGREVLLSTLSQLLTHGPGKSGQELEILYERTKKKAAELYGRRGFGWGPALINAFERGEVRWEDGLVKRQRLGDPGGGGLGGGGGNRLCSAFNSLAGCPTKGRQCANGLHACSQRVGRGKSCGSTAHGQANHPLKKKPEEKKEEELTGGVAASSSSSGVGGGADRRSPDERASHLRGVLRR
jgi:hypothetical protein